MTEGKTVRKNQRWSDLGIEEAERRAAVLDRYVAIDLPTADDDASAASELNLSVYSMTRLAEVWRRHRDPTLLVGMRKALVIGSEAERDKVMAHEVDLDQVRPDRREEIMRRIRIMQRHLSAAEQGEDDIEAAAAEIGVSVPRFRVLLRTWQLHGAADMLPGAKRRGTPWRRRPDHLRRLQLVNEALATTAPTDTKRKAYDAFVRACEEEGITPLSLKRFYGIAAGKLPTPSS